MSEIDETAREDGYCGYIGDGRETPCRLVEGWGYDNATAGLCRNHGDRGGKVANQNATGNSGGPPDSNDNAVTHGAFREQFNSHLTDAEEQAFADAFEQLGTPEGAQDIARTAAVVCLLQFQRSRDERFLRRFESISEKFNITPSEEMDHNHRHAHKHDYDHDRELTDREISALDSITGGPETIEVETAESPDWSEDAGDTEDTGDDDSDDDSSDDDSGGPKIGF